MPLSVRHTRSEPAASPAEMDQPGRFVRYQIIGTDRKSRLRFDGVTQHIPLSEDKLEHASSCACLAHL